VHVQGEERKGAQDVFQDDQLNRWGGWGDARTPLWCQPWNDVVMMCCDDMLHSVDWSWLLIPPLPFPAPPPCRIFCGLGHPGSQAEWPGVEHLRHWREDTGGCRQRRPEHGSINLKQLLWENSPLLRCAGAAGLLG
jgi:hypothetical protein